MADPTLFQLLEGRQNPIFAVHNKPVTAMLLLLISLFRRKRAFRWSPAVDLSDPYIAAALVPMSHS